MISKVFFLFSVFGIVPLSVTALRRSYILPFGCVIIQRRAHLNWHKRIFLLFFIQRNLYAGHSEQFSYLLPNTVTHMLWAPFRSIFHNSD